MNENELRRGNYLYFNSKDNGKILSKVTDLKENFIAVILENGVYRENKERFIPINLNEYFLLKFGAKHDYTNGDLKYFKINHISIIFRIKSKTCYFRFDSNGMSVINLKYAHQLQNLYFALTGSELVFSTEP